MPPQNGDERFTASDEAVAKYIVSFEQDEAELDAEIEAANPHAPSKVNPTRKPRAPRAKAAVAARNQAKTNA